VTEPFDRRRRLPRASDLLAGLVLRQVRERVELVDPRDRLGSLARFSLQLSADRRPLQAPVRNGDVVLVSRDDDEPTRGRLPRLGCELAARRLLETLDQLGSSESRARRENARTPSAREGDLELPVGHAVDIGTVDGAGFIGEVRHLRPRRRHRRPPDRLEMVQRLSAKLDRDFCERNSHRVSL
jgi:hypothetical protein